MNIIIHRGTHEIGGSCVEVQHENTRLVIDIGMPLVTSKGERFDIRTHDGLSESELVSQGILPRISGFYRGDIVSAPVNGLLVSHAHFDHYGFASYLRDDIKFHLGEGTRQLMEMSSTFSGHKCNTLNYSTFVSGKPFKVGSITVTPYLADHSAFDAYSFLLEAGGKRLVYTGDFREHGRKSAVFGRMTKDIAKGVDALLLEGTMIGRNSLVKTENNIEEEFCSLFKSEPNIVLIAASGQNIDRIVSIYRAAKRSGRLFVIDPYVAHILTGLSKLAKLPHPSPLFPDVRVYFPQRFCRWLSRNGKDFLFKPFGLFKISYAELNKKRDKIIILVRPSTLDYLKKIDGIDGATLVWSQWEGYLKDDTRQISTLHDFIEQRGIKLRHIHTSGHASIDTMKKLTEAIQPKLIVPIHTSYPERYSEIFPDIRVANVVDGETIAI